ncbi:M67 family metallopeptidase [Magnetospirillum sp. UT-4]|uniref:M67 family metallopeptidase n=1 Tax=Magnetospirillum sp. UT-4 TaxID=2681467 RepID=UPI001384FB74|nr:M67 family metallopeptidase [Magnetospirillum sp. UT-4]CAA7622521.1 Mov34/MPN/PAD-1 [Magnetospirillum sp. UT-4]
MILQIEAGLLKQMADAAEAAFPAEACGLIVGRGRGQLVRVTRVVAAPNLLAADTDRFEVDPAVRLRLERDLREAGGKDRLIGHYHSHTDGTADPSGTDRALAFEPDLAWVIIGVLDGQTVQTLAHRLDEKRGSFRPVPIRTPKKNACKPPPHSA